ncbi:hypothetical protein AB0I49_01085 [Streptomyces sp. NPDC050617]|uniref:hypothetical protein n=1 Tax=Streptomyces sp. NPDC050617 TaxID=3154628 RepID=UPI00342FEE6E
MGLPFISLNFWWGASVTVTAIFLAFFIPLMPNKQYRIRMLLAPVLGIAFCVIAAMAKGLGAGEVLPMYSFAILAFPAGFIGHRREFRKRLLDRVANGESPANGLSMLMQLQLVLVIAVAASIGALFSMSAP